MAETMNQNMILGLEKEIANEFSTMMMNDAMISIQIHPKGISKLVAGELESVFGDKQCQVIGSVISWQEEVKQEFIISEEDAIALISKINEFNDAIDSLDVLLENWNLAAQHNLSKGLDPAPNFSSPELDNRIINDSDIISGGFHIKYDVEIDDTKFHLSRIVEGAWQTILDAANLEVTTVDDVGMNRSRDVEIEQPAFGDLSDGPDSSSHGFGHSHGKDLSMLFDLKLDVVVELGRTKKPVEEILQLGRGAIVELEKLAGDPVEIYVNNKKLALGEVVVVDDHFGVRVTQLVKQSENTHQIGE